MLLEYFGDDRDGGVDGVRDHEDKCLGGVLRNTGRKVANNTSVDLEEVISVRRTLSVWKAHTCIQPVPSHLKIT